MTPLQCYEDYLRQEKIRFDPLQRQIILQLDTLYHHLLKHQSSWVRVRNYFCRKLRLRLKPVTGIYLWGGVGRGKTFLMDLFFQSLPMKQKSRFHFHRFMYFVHSSLKMHQGKPNPLQIIAKEFAARSHILCFDEFYVSDISDAMILAELFRHLFAQGISLVATSNLPPEALYANGLQREKFLPTIALLQKFTHVLSLAGDLDYRLQYLRTTELYHYPLSEQADQQLAKYFTTLASQEGLVDHYLTITDRLLLTRRTADGVVWFEFEELCIKARSALDYIEIARCYHTVLMSNIKIMRAENEDAARRFIALIDEFYERHVTLIISAEAPIENLYQGQRHCFEFQRTMSRLIEMQSSEYLAKPHLA